MMWNKDLNRLSVADPLLQYAYKRLPYKLELRRTCDAEPEIIELQAGEFLAYLGPGNIGIYYMELDDVTATFVREL